MIMTNLGSHSFFIYICIIIEIIGVIFRRLGIILRSYPHIFPNNGKYETYVPGTLNFHDLSSLQVKRISKCRAKNRKYFTPQGALPIDRLIIRTLIGPSQFLRIKSDTSHFQP